LCLQAAQAAADAVANKAKEARDAAADK